MHLQRPDTMEEDKVGAAEVLSRLSASPPFVPATSPPLRVLPVSGDSQLALAPITQAVSQTEGRIPIPGRPKDVTQAPTHGNESNRKRPRNEAETLSKAKRPKVYK